MFNSNSIHSKLKLLEIQFSFYFLSLRFDVSQSHIGVKTKQTRHFWPQNKKLKNKSYFLMQTYLIGIKWAVLFSSCYTGPVNKINTSKFFQSPFQP